MEMPKTEEVVTAKMELREKADGFGTGAHA
jgi:hypothetical protein